MTAGTWEIIRIDDGLPCDPEHLDLEGVQDAMAEFFATADSALDGTGIVIRKAPDQGRVPPEIQRRVPRTRGHLSIVK